jgi:hypothetical protein
MLPSYIGNRDPGPRGLLHDPKLLVDGIPSTALNTRINLNSFYIRRHSRMTRLTPSSYLRQHCPVEMGAASERHVNHSPGLGSVDRSSAVVTHTGQRHASDAAGSYFAVEKSAKHRFAVLTVGFVDDPPQRGPPPARDRTASALRQRDNLEALDRVAPWSRYLPQRDLRAVIHCRARNIPKSFAGRFAASLWLGIIVFVRPVLPLSRAQFPKIIFQRELVNSGVQMI